MSENLTTLQQMSKWSKEELYMVRLTEKDVQPLNYPLVKIVDLFTGDDNTARAVLIRTANGTYKRAIAKLIPVDSDRK